MSDDDLVERLHNWETIYDCDKDKPDGSLYAEAVEHMEELEAERDAAYDAGVKAGLDAAAELAGEAYKWTDHTKRCCQSHPRPERQQVTREEAALAKYRRLLAETQSRILADYYRERINRMLKG